MSSCHCKAFAFFRFCAHIFEIPNFQRFTEFWQVQVTTSTYASICTVLHIDVHMPQKFLSDSLRRLYPWAFNSVTLSLLFLALMSSRGNLGVAAVCTSTAFWLVHYRECYSIRPYRSRSILIKKFVGWRNWGIICQWCNTTRLHANFAAFCTLLCVMIWMCTSHSMPSALRSMSFDFN